MLLTKQRLPPCLRRPSLFPQEQLQLALSGVSLWQGSHGDHCVLHEFFSSQKEKEGRVAVVVVGVE